MIDIREALELFKKNPHGYDAIITDMNMPHLNGDMLALEAVTIQPDIPVILISGFITSIYDSKIQQKGIKAFIRKPCKKNEMARTIRNVLKKH